MPEKEQSIGALWMKDGPRGTYLTGKIEGVGAVVCFQNKSDNPKAPQWRVLKARPKSDAEPTAPVAKFDPDDVGF